MTCGEFWILDVVLDSKVPLSALEPDNLEELEMVFNRKWHGLAHEALVDVLTRLFDRGDLSAERARGPHDQEAEDLAPLVLARADIEEALLNRSGENAIYYGLTPQGGARWESVARPDWHSFVEHWQEAPDDEEDSLWGTIQAMDRSLVERYFACALADGRAVPGTEAWEETAPWEATYWKLLPRGYGVRYRAYREGESRLAVPAWSRQVATTMHRDRWGYPFPLWYTNPWDAPQPGYLF